MQGIKRVLTWSVFLLMVVWASAGCSGGTHMSGNGAMTHNGGTAPATGNAPTESTAPATGPAPATGTAPTTGTAPAAHAVVRVDVGYLSHPPVRAAVDEVNKLLETYGDKVQVSRYDLESKEGKAFADSVKLTVHTPLAIYINGKMEVEGQDGRQVKLFSFPSGLGSGATPGSGWTMDDLKVALDRAVGGQK